MCAAVVINTDKNYCNQHKSHEINILNCDAIQIMKKHLENIGIFFHNTQLTLTYNLHPKVLENLYLFIYL